MKQIILTLLTFFCITSWGAGNANFSMNKQAGCPPLLVNFTVAPSTSATYSWDFGNGNTSALSNPSAMFTTPGSYMVKLVYTDGTITDSAVTTITVYSAPQFDFEATDVSVCLYDTLKLNSSIISSTSSIVDYAWDFGDGVSSSGINAAHKYDSAGVYNIALVLQDSNSCTHNLIKTAYVSILTPPVAAFSANPLNSCQATETVSFTNLSTGNGLSYSWVLDDNVTSNLQNPVYTYVQEVDVVKLITTDIEGCRASVTKTIRVVDVNADFTIDKHSACTEASIKFTNTSNFRQYSRWDFGDGTFSTALDPVKSYSTSGIYTVKLINSYFGCTDSIVKTDFVAVNTCLQVGVGGSTTCSDSVVVKFTNTSVGTHQSWNFGDGHTSLQVHPTHAYYANGTYYATHNYLSTSGVLLSDTVTVTIKNSRPTPIFNIDTAYCTNGNLRFINLGLNSVRQLWDFGDGSTSTAINLLHAFAAAGTYVVSLTVWNASGCDSTLTRTIHISDLESEISVNKTFSPCPPFVALFKSTTNRSNVTYQWQFGDGGTQSLANPTHVYFYPGVYDVALITKTTTGCIDTTLLPKSIHVQGPSGQFSATPLIGCVPHTVQVNAQVSSNVVNMWADMGDGTLVSNSQMFSHTYTYTDSFLPKFILVDSIGCTVPYSLPSVLVGSPPVMSLKDTAVCVGSPIAVNFNSGTYQWSPNTYLSCDTCAQLTITPTTSIEYEVITTNQFCSTTGNLAVEVVNVPTSLGPQVVNTCAGSSVVLHSMDADSITWTPALYLNNPFTPSPTCTPAQNIEYQIRAYNRLGCYSTDTIQVIALPNTAIAVDSDITICAGDSFQLVANLLAAADSAVRYQWTPQQYLTSSNADTTMGYNLTKTTTFTITAQHAMCGTDTKTVTVHVEQAPELAPLYPLTTFPGQAIELGTAEATSFTISNNQNTYQWQATDSLVCEQCATATLFPLASQMVQVSVQNSYGCTTRDSVLVSVVGCDPETVFVPNIFSPNGDGLNDQLIIGTKALSHFDYMRIFNRWGELVYQTTDSNQSWDGAYNGKIAFDEVFVYALQGKCQSGSDVTKSGSITVVR